ncbi:hypothetical protein MHB85_07780 [Paenibacillus sp. FSL K6-4396]|uniref:hypothetical protein n=1 Tax=unclassified Paenibacillus TaxID=185978 RepID=UPI0017845CA5|nr:hypothetical protein [Paenibacillus sp. CFBP 13594]MBD8840069.1 hypothetical protein [Paenibacillus sp. CFBP 13594]
MDYAIICMNEVFPSDNDVAKWVVGLAVIHNDFLFLKKKLFKSSDVLSDLISEAPSILKILTASLREAIFYLEESEKLAEIRTYINSLPEQLIQMYMALKLLFRNGAKADLLQKLTNARNITYHYSKPQRNELSEALKALSNEIIFYEENDQRFLFAEHVRNTILLNSLFSSNEIRLGQELPISELIISIKESIETFIDFSNKVSRHYLEDFCE